MSNLHKSMKMPKPPSTPNPHPPPPLFSMSAVPEEAEGDEDSSSVSSLSSAGTIVPAYERLPKRPPTQHSSWHDYFDQELYLELDSERYKAKYHVYLNAPAEPSKDPLFVCLHGAGASALSFALFTRELRSRLPKAGVLSVDAREHGSMVESATGEVDLSREALVEDLVNMINLTQVKLSWPMLPTLVLIGHSLGGAVVSKVAKNGSLGPKLLGYVVIDVVEGSALQALENMQLYLSNLPSSFPSIDTAIDWQVRSRTIRNIESARISTPPLFKLTDSGAWMRRKNLAETQPYWESWFTGLSDTFLTGKGAKMLILAGTDRLDKALMIGQMQGKFQLHVFPEAGHFVQEDAPGQTADAVVEFFKRNDKSAFVLPPKVDDLLKQGKKV